MIRSRFFFALMMGAAFLLILVATAAGTARHIASRPTLAAETRYYYIPKGSGMLRAAYGAQQDGLVGAVWHFRLAARLKGLEKRLQAGEYEVTPGMRLDQLLAMVASGARYQRRVTIPEGQSVAEIQSVLQSAFGLEDADTMMADEGDLLPDTYQYERGDNAASLIGRMKKAMSAELLAAWQARPADLPFDSMEDALILASIVEKETGIATERPLVAAVFINRLRRGMRLQSDPTVIYGITGGLPLGRALTGADLKAETPYNTYRIKGLPPTPIANPGAAAIQAVLNPAPVDYLYFVADGTGGHAFARTLDEHNRNVKTWRRLAQKNAGRAN